MPGGTEVFKVQADSVQFLIKNHYDFQKTFAEGIGWVLKSYPI